MKRIYKEIGRYILLAFIMYGAYLAIDSAYILVNKDRLSTEYAAIITMYLGVWGYIVKWFFSTAVIGDTDVK